MTSTAILPTRTNVDPHNPETNEYFEPGMAFMVLADLRGTPRRLVALHGGRLPSDMPMGTSHEFHHDQAGYTFGLLKVVGLFGEVFETGTVPTRKLPLAVFK